MSSNSIKEIYYLCNDKQRQEKLASLILYTKHMLKSTYKITTQRKLVFLRCNQIETWKLNTNWRFIFFPHNSGVLSMGRLATISFSILTKLNKYLFTMEIEFRVISLETRCTVFVFHKQYFKWCIINATKEKYQFILKIYVGITLRINTYIWSYDSQSVNSGIWT